MSTYSHLSAIKTGTVKNQKQPVRKKNRKQGHGIAGAFHVANNNCIHTWYSSRLYPELAD